METRAPKRPVSAAPSGEATRDARLSGSVRTPASTGEKPRRFWRYSITKKITPSMTKKLSATMIVPVVSVGLRNSRIGSSGCSVRFSYQPKTMRTRTPMTTAASVPARRPAPGHALDDTEDHAEQAECQQYDPLNVETVVSGRVLGPGRTTALKASAIRPMGALI